MTSQINSSVDEDRTAVVLASPGERRSFQELEERSRQLAQLFRARGIGPGGQIAVLLDNHIGYHEVCWAARRAGLRFTPINWHLGAQEAGYILADCGATGLVTSARLEQLVIGLAAHMDNVAVHLAHDGELEGFDAYETAITAYPTEPPADETEGAYMFYTSGTTGRPKGIKHPSVVHRLVLRPGSTGSSAPSTGSSPGSSTSVPRRCTTRRRWVGRWRRTVPAAPWS